MTPIHDFDRRAEAILRQGNCSLAVVTEEGALLCARGSSVRPLLMLVEKHHAGLFGCHAADHVVGKAAAALYVRVGAASVFGETMSEAGLQMLRAHGIAARWGKLVPGILNRTGEALCPMEQCVAALDNPAECEAAIRHFVRETPLPPWGTPAEIFTP